METPKFTLKTLNQDGARFLSNSNNLVGYRKEAKEFSASKQAQKVAEKLEGNWTIVQDAFKEDVKRTYKLWDNVEKSLLNNQTFHSIGQAEIAVKVY